MSPNEFYGPNGALNLCLLCPQLCPIFVLGIVIEFVFGGLDGMDRMDGWVGDKLLIKLLFIIISIGIR
jgi:hypothetical protein